MEKESVNVIRESTRNLIKINRRSHRDEENDVRRCLEKLRLSSDTPKIANKLKTKAPISLPELLTLKNELLDDPKNVELVLSTHGTLKGLVRELTGCDVKKQIAAAGCLCNLSLGDSSAGVAVAKAAGPYLIAALDNLTVELVVPCAWAVGNICGSGSRACALLSAQGAGARLCALLAGTQDGRDAAVYALAHYAYIMREELTTEHLTKILEALSKIDMDTTPSSSQLLFILSCHKDFNLNVLTLPFLHKILKLLAENINKHLLTCEKSKSCCDLVNLVRTLANIEVNDVFYHTVLNYFLENDGSEVFRTVLGTNDDFKDSLLWLLGNLFNYNSDHVFFNDLLK